MEMYEQLIELLDTALEEIRHEITVTEDIIDVSSVQLQRLHVRADKIRAELKHLLEITKWAMKNTILYYKYWRE